jgi:hypothetical protein
LGHILRFRADDKRVALPKTLLMHSRQCRGIVATQLESYRAISQSSFWSTGHDGWLCFGFLKYKTEKAAPDAAEPTFRLAIRR